MSEIIKGSIYHSISEKLLKKIDKPKLPVFGEFELRKISADLYGKIKIKLDLETDITKLQEIHEYEFNLDKNSIKRRYHTYKWEVNEENLPKSFEKFVKPKIEEFILLFSIIHKNDENTYCFSVVDGAFKEGERSGHHIATEFAIIQLFKNL